MTSVYRKVLGGDFKLLAAELQYFHSLAGRVELSGRVSIKGPHRAAGRWMAWLFGLPKTTPETCFRFELDADAGQETWRRYFPGRPMVSRMRAGAGVLVERFGPIKFHFRLTADEGRLPMRPQAVTVFGIPLPKLMMPTVTAEETGADGKLHFIVAVHLPLVGLLAEYRGYLDVEKNPNVVPAKTGIHALHEFPPCHLSVVTQYAATSASLTGYGFPPARERRGITPRSWPPVSRGAAARRSAAPTACPSSSCW